MKEKNILFFKKDGEEIKDQNQIIDRIKNINKELSNEKLDKNNIFYILEIPIKTIENNQLLEKCYFMDIPGLNEACYSYIEVIFSLISLDDILFEIMIFDSNSFSSDSVLNIFKQLEKKKCLIKENNIYILNKIDRCENRKEVINNFLKIISIKHLKMKKTMIRKKLI